MISICPICGYRIKSGKKCPECNFDISTDYEGYRTLCTIEEGNTSTYRQRKEHEQKILKEFFLANMGSFSQQVGIKIGKLEKEISQLKKQIKDLKTMDISEAKKEEKKEESSTSKVKKDLTLSRGDLIPFGKYVQNEDGKKISPIYWRVIKVYENHTLLLLCEYGLDIKRFDENVSEWRLCGLREWLNNEFYNMAFSDKEKEMMAKIYLNDPVANSWDYVSLPNPYIANTVSRWKICYPTPYASKIRQEMWMESNSGKKSYPDMRCGWWLRVPGQVKGLKYVDLHGKINHEGIDENTLDIAIRPIIVISTQEI